MERSSEWSYHRIVVGRHGIPWERCQKAHARPFVCANQSAGQRLMVMFRPQAEAGGAERIARRSAEEAIDALATLSGVGVAGAHLMPVSAAGYRLCTSILQGRGG